MGIITMGIPEEPVVELVRLSQAKVFIETGTFQGGTTRWAAGHFETVHTIEKAKVLFDLYSDDLMQIDGVVPHFGDSRQILPKILGEIGSESAVHWLDGHWSGGDTAGEDDECPLLHELASLSARPQDIILIDDARLFLCAPPLPHDASQWPTISDIIDALPVSDSKPIVQIIDDVIFVVPNRKELKEYLIAYAQRRADMFRKEFAPRPRRRRNRFPLSLFR